MEKKMKKTGFISGMVLFCWFLLFPAMVSAVGSFAILAEFSGEVMIKNAEEWVSPEVDMPLYSGAKIVTKDGSALVLFKDGATMTVDPFSSIRAIDQLQEGTTDSREQMRIRRIRIMLGRTKYDEQPVAARQTRIEMPTAVAALRGTGGYFGSNEDNRSQGALYEGNMDISGIFEEIIPQIMAFENALNSSTWTASLSSAGQVDNHLANVHEIQAEIQTFAANLDPQMQTTVQQTLAVITPVLQGLQQKVQKAQQAETRRAAAQKVATEDSRPRVRAIGQKTAKTAETFVRTAQESAKTDISLVLATLKGDQKGVATAQAAKQQNDRAVAAAGQAAETSARAVDMAEKAVSGKQVETAESVANTASNTAEAMEETVRATNTVSMMVSRDNQEGVDKMARLDDATERILASAEKNNKVSQNAIVLSEKEETVDMALETARISETASKVIQETSQKMSQAAQAVADNDANADSAVEDAKNQSETLDSINQSLDENIEKTSDFIPAEEEAEEETDTEPVDSSPPPEPEAYEEPDEVAPPQIPQAPDVEPIPEPIPSDEREASPV
jgi:hypothetical protein